MEAEKDRRISVQASRLQALTAEVETLRCENTRLKGRIAELVLLSELGEAQVAAAIRAVKTQRPERRRQVRCVAASALPLLAGVVL